MTDTVLRQDVIDAVRSVPPGTTCRGDAIIAAINAIPTVDEWQPIETAPKDGTVFLAIRPTGAGHPSYMLPYVMRHEGRLYSTFQYNNGSLWVDWPKPDPTLWKPIDMPSLVAALGE
jgi:hypothetical protein